MHALIPQAALRHAVPVRTNDIKAVHRTPAQARGLPGSAVREPPRSTLMRASSLHAVALMLGIMALATCTSTEEELIERGYPPAYAEGFEHGCASGKATAGGLFEQAQKDESRYQDSTSEYAKGWDAGYAKCQREMRAMVVDARTRNPSRDK
jgi:hypothetical protein